MVKGVEGMEGGVFRLVLELVFFKFFFLYFYFYRIEGGYC